MQNNRIKRLQDEIIEAVYQLDHFSLQKLSAFIAGLESVKAQGKESEGTGHEDG